MRTHAPAVVGYYDEEKTAQGGTTRYLLDLVESLDRSRFSPVFFALERYPWHQALLDLDVDVITLEGREAPGSAAARGQPRAVDTRTGRRSRLHLPARLARTAGRVKELYELTRLFRCAPVDLLHSNQAGAEPAPIAARIAGVPRVLATWHVGSDCDLKRARQGPDDRLLELVCMRSLDHAISVSDATKRDWVRRCRLSDAAARRVTVIHNGVVLDRLARRRPPGAARARFGIPADALVIGSVGKLAPIKGYDVLLGALPEIVGREPRLHVLIGGEGPAREELVALARRLGLLDRLYLAGFVSDVREVLDAMDIYVQPSRSEAHGIALLEAGAFALPAVASATGGIPETVIDGETGFLIPVGDTAALMRALSTLADRPELRVELGRRARERIVREFSHDRTIARTMAVYDTVLAQAPASRGASRGASSQSACSV